MTKIYPLNISSLLVDIDVNLIMHICVIFQLDNGRELQWQDPGCKQRHLCYGSHRRLPASQSAWAQVQGACCPLQLLWDLQWQGKYEHLNLHLSVLLSRPKQSRPRQGFERLRQSLEISGLWPRHVRAANRYGKKLYLLRNLEGNTKVHPKSMILASYGTECYRHSFPTVKANTRRLF